MLAIDSKGSERMMIQKSMELLLDAIERHHGAGIAGNV